MMQAYKFFYDKNYESVVDKAEVINSFWVYLGIALDNNYSKYKNIFNNNNKEELMFLFTSLWIDCTIRKEDLQIAYKYISCEVDGVYYNSIHNITISVDAYIILVCELWLSLYLEIGKLSSYDFHYYKDCKVDVSLHNLLYKKKHKYRYELDLMLEKHQITKKEYDKYIKKLKLLKLTN